MLQCLLCRDAVGGIIHKDPAEKIKEIPAETVVAWYDVLHHVS